MAFRDKNDKRCASRSCHDTVVEIRGMKKGGLETGRLCDFSNTGAAFLSAGAFAVGDKLNLRIRLLHKGIMDASAVVVRVSKGNPLNQYGVKFEKLQQVHPTGEYKAPGCISDI